MLLATGAGATTYSVGPTRSYASPCALVAAVSLLPGDTIAVDPATYTDACELTASGNAAAPIQLKGLSGPMPLFDATGVTFINGSSVTPKSGAPVTTYDAAVSGITTTAY